MKQVTWQTLFTYVVVSVILILVFGVLKVPPCL